MKDNEKKKKKDNDTNLNLTISERIIAALTTGALMLVGGIALILLSPVFFVKELLTKKATDWKALKKAMDDMGEKLDELADPDSDEDWKKDHKNQYGK